jgi:hypothetical protein
LEWVYCSGKQRRRGRREKMEHLLVSSGKKRTTRVY